ncbi:MAG: alpha/beta fold hydrolase, partial [bacterium]
MYDGFNFEIQSTYDWCVRAFSVVKNRLGLNINFYHDEGQIEAGQIFLFNHFARFETIIPNYLRHQATGAYCRCVAAAELFEVNDKLTRFLLSLGAVPHNLPGLLPFLAAEILRGRKVIVFPEGGMVKDRRTIDAKGRHTIYSPISQEWRKHHSGAAVIALTLEIFKKRIMSVCEKGEDERIERWAESLGIETPEKLMEAVEQPTLIIPGNITFYPMRVAENILTKIFDLFGSELKGRALEEMLIEGNIMFENTDMDIRLTDAIPPGKVWRWWERKLLGRLFDKIDSLDDLFSSPSESAQLDEQIVHMLIRRETRRIRDSYMREMYTGVTVNLSHLASTLIQMYVSRGEMEVDRDLFHRALYLSIKYVQAEPSVHLHQSVANPEAYEGIGAGLCAGLEQFMSSKACSGLIARESDRYRFLPSLLENHDFHEVRLKNLVSIYANEMAPVAAAVKSVERALKTAPRAGEKALALSRFDDELISYAWSKKMYSKPEFEEINAQETATESGEPYLLLPDKPRDLGVVLVHGFLASPAELRHFGEKLEAAGYPVIGVRLKGHGTSPWDLRNRSWQDWLQSVRRGYRIISAFADRICLIGFSSGGALALHHAADQPDGLAGAVTISTPIKFRNRNMIFVPLVYGGNQFTPWVPIFERVKPFLPNPTEHPHIKYHHMPIRGLYELRQMVAGLKRRLPNVACPTLVIQGTDDGVVNPESAEIILKGLGSENKRLHKVPSERHGLVNEDIGDTHEKIMSFLESLSSGKRNQPRPSACPAQASRSQTIPAKPVYSLIDDAVAGYGGNPCIDFFGKKYTYREVGELVNRAARGFQQLGVGKGVKVGLCLPNTPYSVICYYAILKAGGTVVNYNPLYVERELVQQIEDSETDIMVTLDLQQIYPKVAAMLERTRLKTIVLCRMGEILPPAKGLLFSILKYGETAAFPDDLRHVPFERLINNDGNIGAVEIDPHEDVAVLQYTGGTTGAPKGAMLTHANLSANAVQACEWFVGADMGAEKILGVLPLFHVFAMTLVMNMGVALASELILLPRFELDTMLQTIHRARPTMFIGVPTIYTAINSSSRLDLYDLSSLNYCISGGAPLPLEVKAEFERLTGCEVVEGYGLSECSPVATCNPLVGAKKEGSIGLPMPGTLVEIRNADYPGKLMPIGEKGEVCVTGPQVMAGYWKRPEETSNTIQKNRLHTGD